MSSVDTNQASEDAGLKEILDNLAENHLAGWQDINFEYDVQAVNSHRKVNTSRLSGEIYANKLRLIENSKQAIEALIRTEKLKLLADVRERVVGENEPEFNTPRPELGNMARNRLREAQADLLNKLEAEL